MARTTTVTFPDGTIAKRTSKSRVYSHAVVEEISREALVADAQWSVDHADGEWRKWAGILSTMTPADVTEKRRSWSFGGEYVDLSVCGEWVKGYTTEREEDPTFEALKAIVAKNVERAVEIEADRRARLEARKNGPERVFGVLRWSSREDLARKAAEGEFGRLVREGVKVYVVECQEA